MRARLRRFVAAASLTLACASAVQAEPMAYAAGFDDLFRIDLATGQATRIGAFGGSGGVTFVDVEGLAIAPDGTLYGVADAQKLLFRVDTSNGHASLVGALRENGQPIANDANLDFGLAFTCDGRLWLSSDKRALLWEVDPGSGNARLVGATGAKISGLAARGDRLVGIGVEGSEGLYSVDRDTGAASLIAPLAPHVNFTDAGLDFDAEGRLWAVRDFFPPDPASDIVRIDVTTGAIASVAPVRFAPGVVDKEIETLAIAAPGGCLGTGPVVPPGGVTPGVQQIPATGRGALALLAALLAAFAALALRRAAPIV